MNKNLQNTAEDQPASVLDLEEYEALMELVFAYTSAAQDFGFTHKINNRLTSLSMNASFLKTAIEKNDIEKAELKVNQVVESIKNLVDFSQSLMSTDLDRSTTEELDLSEFISETTEALLSLPTFSRIELKQALTETSTSTQVNPKIIQIILYAYFKHIKRITVDGPVVLSSSIDSDQSIYILKADINKILKAPVSDDSKSSLTFPSAGEIPLRYLARVIRNISGNVELVYREERPLHLELRIEM